MISCLSGTGFTEEVAICDVTNRVPQCQLEVGLLSRLVALLEQPVSILGDQLW